MSFQHLFLEYKATRKSNHQCALITRSFLVFRYMMKAVTAALTKNTVSNAKVRSFRRAFLGIAAETKFSLQVSGHQAVQ